MAGYKVETKSEVVPTNSAVINISIIAGFKDNNREIKILKQVPPTFHASRRRAPPTITLHNTTQHCKTLYSSLL